MNLGKTNIVILGRDLHILKNSGKYLCAVCMKGDKKNSMFRNDFNCRRCLGNARVIDGRPCTEVQLADNKLDVLENFVYLGGYICSDGGCELATIKRCQKYRELLPLLTCTAIFVSEGRFSIH